MDSSVPTVGSYLEKREGDNLEESVEESSAAPPGVDGDAKPLDPLVLIAFTVVLLAVCWQNWVLARRAENKSLIPDWLGAQRPESNTKDIS